MKPEALRHDLVHGHSADLDRRRAIIGVSLLGLASMTASALLQTGLVKHLPDPPLPGFNSDKVNLSRTAYLLGVPDGALAVTAFALNILIAAFGGGDRPRRLPWAPIAATAKAAADAAVSGWYLVRMPAKERAWCAYRTLAAESPRPSGVG